MAEILTAKGQKQINGQPTPPGCERGCSAAREGGCPQVPLQAQCADLTLHPPHPPLYLPQDPPVLRKKLLPAMPLQGVDVAVEKLQTMGTGQNVTVPLQQSQPLGGKQPSPPRIPGGGGCHEQ